MTKIVLFFKYPNFFNFFLNLFCSLIKLIIFVKNMEKYIGKYRFINDKLHKLKEDEKFNNNSEEEKVR
jgi:hypothetical protein